MFFTAPEGDATAGNSDCFRVSDRFFSMAGTQVGAGIVQKDG